MRLDDATTADDLYAIGNAFINVQRLKVHHAI